MATESEPTGTPKKKLTLGTVLIPFAIILTIILVVAGYMSRPPGQHEHAGSAIPGKRTVGMQIPDFELQTLEGATTKLSDVKAKVILINFWATWCPPCVKEMPSLQKLSDEYSKQGLTVIGVNLDEEKPEVIQEFLKKNSIKFQSFVDPEGKVAEQFSVSGLPLTLVIDANRKLLLEQTGDEDWYASTVRKQFEKWLAEN